MARAAIAARVGLAGLLLSALIGIFLGVTLYSFDYAEGASYLSSDPKACANCHIMRDELDSWQKSPHHAAAVCNDCHVPQHVVGKYATKVEHGYRHSKGFTFQDFHEPIQITPRDLKIVERNCMRCHSEFVSEISHEFDPHNQEVGSELLSCTHCHAGIGHGPRR
jgi:cytochrome c nitrite reductase small subunit